MMLPSSGIGELVREPSDIALYYIRYWSPVNVYQSPVGHEMLKIGTNSTSCCGPDRGDFC